MHESDPVSKINANFPVQKNNYEIGKGKKTLESNEILFLCVLYVCFSSIFWPVLNKLFHDMQHIEYVQTYVIIFKLF